MKKEMPPTVTPCNAAKNDKLEGKVQVVAMSPVKVCGQGSLRPDPGKKECS